MKVAVTRGKVAVSSSRKRRDPKFRFPLLFGNCSASISSACVSIEPTTCLSPLVGTSIVSEVCGKCWRTMQSLLVSLARSHRTNGDTFSSLGSKNRGLTMPSFNPVPATRVANRSKSTHDWLFQRLRTPITKLWRNFPSSRSPPSMLSQQAGLALPKVKGQRTWTIGHWWPLS